MTHTSHPRIHAVHLLNDLSGSPLVFKNVLEQLQSSGHDIVLYTATPGGNGFLGQLVVSKKFNIPYQWSPVKLKTLWNFIFAQWYIFFRILFHAKRKDIVYVNTLLPFSAMIAGKLKGAHVRLHIHEISIKPAYFKNVMVKCAELFADEIIFVSNYVKSCYSFKRPKTSVVLNTLSSEFIEKAKRQKQENIQQKNVLMLCSLKAYKGIHEFVRIATLLPSVTFELVLNASQHEIDAWAIENPVPTNCLLYPAQENVHPFYSRAAIVMNLSRPDEWIETFGMTILEAMEYDCFVIVPQVGGPKEVIANYPRSIAMNCQDIHKISFVITRELFK